MPAEKTNNQSGFTIVEVMIVLAIAGLVLAIVFIAVPALQRNSRNTQRRSDLGNLRAQFDTWVSNNGGKLPGIAPSDGLSSIVNSTGWGHYNGNDPLPKTVTLGQATPAHCSDPTFTTQTACENGPDGFPPGHASDGGDAETWTPLSGAQTPAYFVGYTRNRDPSGAPAIEYPDRDEIHIFGEMQCASAILAGGNDADDNGGITYGGTDVVAAGPKALAFVYQIEGEDRARCEDNT